MKLLLLIPMLLMPALGLCDEVITDFGENSIPVLNNELRTLDQEIVALKSRVTTLESSGTSVATQAQMESATSTTVVVTPGRTQYHPGIAKAWCVFNGTTTGTNAPTAGHNVASVTRNGAGDYTITFTTSFSSANYAISGAIGNGATGGHGYIRLAQVASPLATGSARIEAFKNDGTAADDFSTVSFVVFGDQ